MTHSQEIQNLLLHDLKHCPGGRSDSGAASCWPLNVHEVLQLASAKHWPKHMVYEFMAHAGSPSCYCHHIAIILPSYCHTPKFIFPSSQVIPQSHGSRCPPGPRLDGNAIIRWNSWECWGQDAAWNEKLGIEWWSHVVATSESGVICTFFAHLRWFVTVYKIMFLIVWWLFGGIPWYTPFSDPCSWWIWLGLRVLRGNTW